MKFDDFGKVQSLKKKWNRKSKYFDANDEIIEHQKNKSKGKNEKKKRSLRNEVKVKNKNKKYEGKKINPWKDKEVEEKS